MEVTKVLNTVPENLLLKKRDCTLCGCKKTSNSPFCDGTHNYLELQTEEITLLPWCNSITEKLTLLTKSLLASLRNNIAHLSACGGTGKCSTCRVEILDGLENCHPRSELEERLAQSFHFHLTLGWDVKQN